jgi:hypothetical protein
MKNATQEALLLRVWNDISHPIMARPCSPAKAARNRRLVALVKKVVAASSASRCTVVDDPRTL